ncbi:protein YIPF1 homolog [Chenopodium quinoa]|uniref:protein YIPF1 homolog n=1 Tax=Chenopodium quinoa TaxID=63459 RepID=UPI000B76C76D|nr:protein YIPF1 homolog [Chenopodium quinoa]
MDEQYNNLSTSQLLGSVPAVVAEEGKGNANSAPQANLQFFPPHQGGDKGPGYQNVPSSSEGGGPPPTNNWQGVFNVYSYTQYFNVDTDIVINRLLSSLDPRSGDFFSKIDANPDLYGLIWISTTLVFVIASLGNLATYLIGSSSWNFDVSFMSLAASTVYGYAIVVPLGFYFLLQYLGSPASVVRFWCMWGYSLFIFVLSCFLLVIPLEFLRWMIILLASGVSACFVASNLRTYVEGNDLMVVLVAAFMLQFALGLFIKVWFFT